jgi:hypothetical protein
MSWLGGWLAAWASNDLRHPFALNYQVKQPAEPLHTRLAGCLLFSYNQQRCKPANAPSTALHRLAKKH